MKRFVQDVWDGWVQGWDFLVDHFGLTVIALWSTMAVMAVVLR